MRNVKLGWVLVAALSAAFVSSAAIAAAVRSTDATSKPTLRMVSESPFVVAGRGFKAGERVKVVAAAGDGELRKTLFASSRGRFTARFATNCRPVFITAVGRKGSRATLRIRGIPPPCGVDPSPGVDLKR
jgi:hypothetical protein